MGNQFFLIVESEYFLLGEEALNAFDVLFKCYHVFNISYPKKHSASFFKFFDFFIYCNTDSSKSAGCVLEKYFGLLN